MQTKRVFTLLVPVLILALFLSACGPQPPVPVEIMYYRRGYVEGSDDAASQKARLIVESFQKYQ